MDLALCAYCPSIDKCEWCTCCTFSVSHTVSWRDSCGSLNDLTTMETAVWYWRISGPCPPSCKGMKTSMYVYCNTLGSSSPGASWVCRLLGERVEWPQVLIFRQLFAKVIIDEENKGRHAIGNPLVTVPETAVGGSRGFWPRASFEDTPTV